MKISLKFTKRIVICVAVAVLLTVFIPCMEATAKSKNMLPKTSTVVVGYYNSDFFQEGMSDDAPKSGYSYEYLQKISDYNGWQYEYVYGEWSDLFMALENGEIDVLAGVSMTEERQEKMLFPNYAMGSERYFIYQKSASGTMNPRDYSTMNGKKIGAIKNNRMSLYLENWAKDHDVNFNIVYYDGFTDRDTDLAAGLIDGIVATDNNILDSSGLSSLVKIGEENFYLAVSKTKPELLQELNNALSIIQEIEPYFLQNLQYSSYGTTITSTTFSSFEQSWLDSHEELIVGYLNNYMPYCGSNEYGRPSGLMVDVFDAISKQLHLTDKLNIYFKPYNSYSELVDALHNDEVDAVFPVGGNAWNQESDHIDATSAVVTAGMVLVYTGEYSHEKMQHIAVCDYNNLAQYYIENYYPQSELVIYDSVEACLKAVSKGEVSGTIINGLRTNLISNNPNYDNLSTLQLEKTDSRRIGVNKGNFPLLLLLNRGLKIIGKDYGINASYNYLDTLYSKTTNDVIREFLYDHIVPVFLIVSALILIFVTLSFGYIMKSKQEKWYKAQAYRDGLSKLSNRLAYEEEIEQIAHSVEDDSLVYVSADINGLKEINDTLGHAVGDTLICDAAACLNKVFGEYGKIYRTGGDEFVALIYVKNANIEKLQEKLTAECDAIKANLGYEVSLSIGYAPRREFPTKTIQELAIIADERMYEQKKNYHNNHSH